MMFRTVHISGGIQPSTNQVEPPLIPWVPAVRSQGGSKGVILKAVLGAIDFAIRSSIGEVALSAKEKPFR
jgi:hypothetical protein